MSEFDCGGRVAHGCSGFTWNATTGGGVWRRLWRAVDTGQDLLGFGHAGEAASFKVGHRRPMALQSNMASADLRIGRRIALLQAERIAGVHHAWRHDHRTSRSAMSAMNWAMPSAAIDHRFSSTGCVAGKLPAGAAQRQMSPGGRRFASRSGVEMFSPLLPASGRAAASGKPGQPCGSPRRVKVDSCRGRHAPAVGLLIAAKAFRAKFSGRWPAACRCRSGGRTAERRCRRCQGIR